MIDDKLQGFGGVHQSRETSELRLPLITNIYFGALGGSSTKENCGRVLRDFSMSRERKRLFFE